MCLVDSSITVCLVDSSLKFILFGRFGFIRSSLLFRSLERSLQDFGFRSPYHRESFEKSPHPKHLHAKLRAVPDRMLHGEEMRVIQLPGSLLWIELCGSHWIPKGSGSRGRQQLPRGRGQWILGWWMFRIKIRRIGMITYYLKRPSHPYTKMIKDFNPKHGFDPSQNKFASHHSDGK